MDNKIIIFEEILPSHRYLIMWYLAKKNRIYYLRINRACKNFRWFKKYAAGGRLKELSVDYKSRMIRGRYYDLAYDNIDNFFHEFKHNIIMEKLGKVYDRTIEDAFKKSLNSKISAFYYLNYLFHQIQNLFPDKKVWFIPAHGVEAYRSDGCEIYDYATFYELAGNVKAQRYDTGNIVFPGWAVTISRVCCVMRKFKIFIKTLGFPFWFCVKAAKVDTRHTAPKKSYKYAIMIISPLRQFANKIQRVDFLLDEKLIRIEETILLSAKRLSMENRRYLISNKLAFIDDIDAFVSTKEMKRIFVTYLNMLFLFFSEKSFILETALKCLLFDLRWEGLRANYEIGSLISCCDFGIQSICRNIIMKKNGTKTWYYMDSQNFGVLFVPTTLNFKRRHNNYGFLNYDFLISWSDISTAYFKSSHNRIGRYYNVGCLWAQHTKEVHENKNGSGLKNDLYNHGYRDEMKMVSVFDSTFHDDCVTPYEDGVLFLKDILRLLNDLPKIFIVFKKKKEEEYHKGLTHARHEIFEIYDKLSRHPRCYSISTCNSPSEIIGFSDLTISFPFTSTTFEALSARKKALWHDAAAKFKETAYDSLPGLVCHSYNELRETAEHLLFKISMDDYENYLDKYVKNNIENYLDGKGIDRFKKLLSYHSV